MNNSKQNGDFLHYTPADDVHGGELVVFRDMVGVAVTDIAAGAVGAVAVTGVYELPNANGLELEAGQAVYMVDGAMSVEAAEGAVKAGVAWAASRSTDATVTLRIN